jgi:hypothetical protein
MELCLFMTFGFSVIVFSTSASFYQALLIHLGVIVVPLVALCIIGIATEPPKQKTRVIDPEELMHIRLYSRRY